MGRLLGIAAVGVAGLALIVTGLLSARTSTGPSAPHIDAVPTPGSVEKAPTSGDTLRPDPAWVQQVAASTGISAPAVRGYATAALRLAKDRPTCRIGWTTIAGIGAIETGHGTHGGAHLTADGRTSRRIVGPALDGTNGNRAIRADAESTQWHGDDTWDRAMGPMQFIPSTWRQWASDGDGDGRKDPNDVDDAAYASARYLCHDGRDMSTGQGWSAAVFSYNHSADYVRSVLSQANRIGAAVG